MHEFILWCGFLGAWLLVLGPVYQAVLELGEEDEAIDGVRSRMATMTPPDPVSPWWWLVPPVAFFLRRARREAFQHALVVQLGDEEYEALTNYVNKAAGWLFVGVGGLLIAVKETWELVESHEWPTWLFWVLTVAMVAVSIGHAAGRTWHSGRERRARAAGATA